jgi:hypothetical protein
VTVAARRRLVVTVCPREPGLVVLPVERGGRAARLNATAILECLRALVEARRLEGCVRLREGCAGGCTQDGPNVSVEIFPPSRAGERPDHVATGWKTYVYSLSTLDCLATILEENLGPVGRRAPARREPRRTLSARAGAATGMPRRSGP